MYSAVPPPDNASSEVERSDEKQNERPPRGVSEDLWKKFQELRKRRIKCCKASTHKRIKDINRNVRKTVLGNFKTDEEIAVLRVEGVARLTSNNRPNQGPDEQDKKNMKGFEERWSELQRYLPTPDAQYCSAKTSEEPTTKDIIEKRLDTAVKEKKFDKAEKLNDQLAECDFAVKVAQAVERRDYTKRKTIEEDRAKKRKRTKPYWAFEQKHRWESKGNM